LRTESDGWAAASWFMFDDRKDCDWFAFMFEPKVGEPRSWIIPFAVATDKANTPGPKRKDPWMRDIPFAKLQENPHCDYENNWKMHE